MACAAATSLLVGPVVSTQPRAPNYITLADVRPLLAPLAVLVLVLGLYPNVLLDKIAPSTESVLDYIEASTGYQVPAPGRLADVFVAGGDGE